MKLLLMPVGVQIKFAVGKLYRNISIICRYQPSCHILWQYVANLFLNLHFSHEKHLFD